MTRLIKFSASVVLGAAVVLVSIQVFLRYVFNAPQAWAEEVGRYLFVWSVFLGSAAALAEDRHIRITVLIERWGSKGERISRWLCRISGLFCFAFVAYYGFVIAYTNRAVQFYTLPSFPRVIFYLSVPVCMTLMIGYILVDIRSQFKR
jgi:TRAP-type C4-dicarboxylate transport system permease small subunit